MAKPSNQAEAAALAKSQGWRVVRKRNNRIVFINVQGQRRTFNNHLGDDRSGRQFENFLRSLRAIGFSYEEPIKEKPPMTQTVSQPLKVVAPTTQDPQPFCEVLTSERHKHGLSFREMGALFEDRPSMVARWIRGETEPSDAQYEILKGLFGWDRDYRLHQLRQSKDSPRRNQAIRGSVLSSHTRRYQQLRKRLTQWHEQTARGKLRSSAIGDLIDSSGVSRSAVYRMLHGEPVTEGSLEVIEEALDRWDAEHQPQPIAPAPAPEALGAEPIAPVTQASAEPDPDPDLELGAIATVMRALGALKRHQRTRVMQYVQARLDDAPGSN